MPNRPLASCSVPTCPNKAAYRGRCEEHAKRYAKERPTGTRAMGKQWREIRDEHLANFPKCAVCGGWASEVHHIRARKAGGTDAEANLESLCTSCHSKKTISEGINPRT
jgi:5-methylcytosine-specific restriction protein A